MPSILTFRQSALLFTRAANMDMIEIEKERDPAPSRASTIRLQTFEELPVWYQDNPYVRSAYRPVSYSSFECLYSWTYVHNETLNIYTHLIPAVLSIFAQISVQAMLSTSFPETSVKDRIVFAINIFAATVTLSLSAGYHTLINHSHHVSSLWLRIDYVGILALILGSFFSGIFVGFYCLPHLQKLYWSMILTLSTLTSILVLHPRLQGIRFRSFRTLAFVATGLSGFAPIAHGLFIYGWKEMWIRSGMPYWLLEGVVYGVGAWVFGSRWPERTWPGKFDVWGGSHQIFHVMVVGAAAVHFWGVWTAYEWNYENIRGCPVSI